MDIPAGGRRIRKKVLKAIYKYIAMRVCTRCSDYAGGAGQGRTAGCTYGKMLMERTDYGKIAFRLFAPGIGAVRVATQVGFQDTLGSYEFFAYRDRGIEPSQILGEVTGPAVEYVLTTPADQAFLPCRPEDITFSRPKNSFAKCAARTVGSTFLNGTSVSVTASTCAPRARITRMKPRAARYKIFRPGGLMTAGCAVTWIPEDN